MPTNLRDELRPLTAGAIPAFQDGVRVEVQYMRLGAFSTPSDEVVNTYSGRQGTVIGADGDFALVQLDGDRRDQPVIFWGFRLRRVT